VSAAATAHLRRAFRVLRKGAWPLALVALALLVGWLRFWSPVRVQVAKVDRGDVVEVAFGRGTIESQREAAVGFDLVGRMSDVLVDEGTRVTLGQELARLETDQAQADLRSAQTTIKAARAALERLAAEEDRARALLAVAEREAGRAGQLFESGAIAAQQHDEAKDRVRVARADLDRVLAQRSEATRGIDVAVGGAEQRRITMVRATLLAPFDGVVTRRLREPGDTVTVGSTVLRIADTDRVHVAAAVDETVLSRLAVGQPAAISFPGEPETIAGRVTRIAWEADRQTHELIVEVTPERFDRRIAIGQRADVHIELVRRTDVVRVPTAMIHRDGAGPFVYVDRGGRVAVVRPRLGATGRDHVEVLDGLDEGAPLLGGRDRAPLEPGRRWRSE
jgi:HlyD family secretion protein